jgi:hypothetical protein
MVLCLADTPLSILPSLDCRWLKDPSAQALHDTVLTGRLCFDAYLICPPSERNQFSSKATIAIFQIRCS